IMVHCGTFVMIMLDTVFLVSRSVQLS
ncbi:MAG: hypothetical protein JWM97_269, partial [Phycisphaerales bacterium]|nr:hypothetical protein [Phycisphaerales bacterium]